MQICQTCGGRGVVLKNMGGGMGGFQMQFQQHCPSCGGRGKTFKQSCDHCHGSKIVPDQKDLKVRIQPGTNNNDKVIFLRQSEQRPGMTPGDVVFNIKQQKHNIFTRVGADLYTTLNISLTQVINGFNKRVKTISGKEITISKAAGSGFQELMKFPGEISEEQKQAFRGQHRQTSKKPPSLVSSFSQFTKKLKFWQSSSSSSKTEQTKDFIKQDQGGGGGAEYRRSLQKEKEKNKKDDQKLLTQIIDIIERNINQHYYDQRYFQQLLNKLFAIQYPSPLLTSSTRLQLFFSRDLVSVLPKIAQPNIVVSLSKLANYYKLQGLDYDQFWESVSKQFSGFQQDLTMEQLLTIIINFAYASRVQTKEMFQIATIELKRRNQQQYNPKQLSLYLQYEDIPKIINTFMHYNRFDSQIANFVADYLESNGNYLTIQIFTQILVLLCNRDTNPLVDLIFRTCKDRAIRSINYIDGSLVYKLVWSFNKAKKLDDEVAFKILSGIMQENVFENYKIQQQLDVITLLQKSGKLDYYTLLKSNFAKVMEIQVEKMNLSQLVHGLWIILDLINGVELQNLQSQNKDQQKWIKELNRIVQQFERVIDKKICELNGKQIVLLVQCIIEAQQNNRRIKKNLKQQDNQLTVFTDKAIGKVLDRINEIVPTIEKNLCVHLIYTLICQGLKGKVNRIIKDQAKVVQTINKLYISLQNNFDQLNIDSLSILLWCSSCMPQLNAFSIEKQLKLLQTQTQFKNSANLTQIIQAIHRIESTLVNYQDSMAKKVLEQCKSLLQYIETFCKQRINEFSAEQFIALFGAYMKMRDGYRVASIQFGEFLERHLLSHISDFDHVQLMILLSVLQHRKQQLESGSYLIEQNNKLIKKLIDAKEKLSQSQMSSLIRDKASTKIRQEIRKTVDRVKNERAHYSDYEVPQDDRLDKWSRVQSVTSQNDRQQRQNTITQDDGDDVMKRYKK